MGYRINIGGMIVECDGPQDILALMQAGHTPAVQRPKPDVTITSAQRLRAKGAGSGRVANPFWPTAWAFGRIVKAHPMGVSSRTICRDLLKRNDSQGLGGMMRTVRAALRIFPAPQEEVVTSARSETGTEAVWYPGKRMDDFIAFCGKNAESNGQPMPHVPPQPDGKK